MAYRGTGDIATGYAYDNSTSTTIDYTNTHTVSLWIKTTDNSSIACPWGFYRTSPIAAFFTNMYIDGTWTNTADEFGAWIRCDVTTRFAGYSAYMPGIYDGNWHHVAYTFDSTLYATPDDIVNIYVDGSLMSKTRTYNASPGAWSAADSPSGMYSTVAFCARRTTTSLDNPFTGDVGEFGFWKRVLSASEIATLAKASPLFVPDLVHYVSCDEVHDFGSKEDGDHKVDSIGSGTTYVDGPSIIRPDDQLIKFPAIGAGAPPSGSYTIYDNYYRQLMAGSNV